MNDRLTPERERATLPDWARHEGVVTVYDCDGHYVGCLGIHRWQQLLADPDVFAELDACRRDLAEEQARTTRLTERLQDIAGRAWRDEGGRIAAAVARDGIADERGAGTEQPA